MSTDRRYFAKIDVGYFDNPKVAELLDEHPRVAILHLRAILYCKQHETDGVFPARLVARLAGVEHCDGQCSEHCGEQCDYCIAYACGLLERIDDRRSEVHDYLKHQDAANDTKQRSSKAKKAANTRWEKHRAAQSNAQGNAQRNAEERRGEDNKSDAERADVTRLCEHLANKVEENGSKRPTISKSWKEAARLLLDKDCRPEADAHRLIDWCQNSAFWRPNIMTMMKFREKYDTLRLQAAKDQPKTTRNPNVPEGW